MFWRAVQLWITLFLAVPGGLLAEGSKGLLVPSAAAETLENWYRVDLGDTPAGWMLEREIRRGDRLTSVSILHLRFRRGASEQSLEIEGRFVETLDGRPINAWSRQSLGLKPVETTWTFESGVVLVETRRDGETRSERMPWPPGEWLTPGQVQERLIEQLASDAEAFTLSGLEANLGLEVAETDWVLDARDEKVLIDGQPRASRRFKQRSKLAPQLESLANVSSEGLLLRSVTSIMGLQMTVTLSTRERVLAHREAPELLARSFIYPDRPIPAPRQVRRALYEIEAEGDLLQDLPSDASQRISSSSAGVRVLVELDSSPRLAGADRPRSAEYLRSSTTLDYEAASVQRLAAKAARDAPPATAAQAEALRRFVADHLTEKNLDSILATASEVAESRAGDCTEHSVLLTALLRAAGIPARVVTGLVYVEEFVGERHLFGYHMWSQALIDDRWIDLDATLEDPFDAAHIALGSSALNDGAATLLELAQLATLIGRARIRVLDWDYRSPLREAVRAAED